MCRYALFHAADIKHALGFWYDEFEEHAGRSVTEWSVSEEDALKGLFRQLSQQVHRSSPDGAPPPIPEVQKSDLPAWAETINAAGRRRKRNQPELSAEDVACFLHQMNAQATVDSAALLLMMRPTDVPLDACLQQVRSCAPRRVAAPPPELRGPMGGARGRGDRSATFSAFGRAGTRCALTWRSTTCSATSAWASSRKASASWRMTCRHVEQPTMKAKEKEKTMKKQLGVVSCV